jgi:nicotinate-nucleotide adenylyltransferase
VRLGIFGGSFDPPHVGHLLVAQDAIAALALDRLMVVPTATQPLKLRHRTDAVHRLAMVQHCFEGVRNAAVDPIEVHRGGLSFMVDTVDYFRAQHPAAVIHLLIGEDVVATLPQWRNPERLLQMVELVILTRGQSPVTAPIPSLPLSEGQGRSETLLPGIVSARRLATRRVDVSSTEIRERVRNGDSIKGFVPDAVAHYIASTALYSGERATASESVRA